MTPKQTEKAVELAVKRLREAADALADVTLLAHRHGVDIRQEERFISELRERANYWNCCTWWKKTAR